MNVLLVVLVAYILVTPYFYAKAVKFGMKLAEKPEKVVSEPFFNVPTQKKKPVMTAEDDRRTQILNNINNYNGSAVGQRKVEVKHD